MANSISSSSSSGTPSSGKLQYHAHIKKKFFRLSFLSFFRSFGMLKSIFLKKIAVFKGGWQPAVIVDHTVIRFMSVSGKFDTGTVVGLNGTLVEAKMFTFTQECTHFIFKKGPILTRDGATS